MIIKRSDDRSEDVRSLRSLLERADLSAELRRRIDREITNVLSGLRGERDAAYEIDFHYGASPNWAVIHDLRVEHQDRVAQIDHVLINRTLDLYVCESKRFSEGIEINDRGEFCALSHGRAYGVPSPIEQNRKHILVLEAILDGGRVDVPMRLGFYLWPKFKSLILVSRNALIVRPKTGVTAIDTIIKTDQVRAYIEKAVDKETGLLDAAKLISPETLARFARSIAALHRPLTVDWARRFGLRDGRSGGVGAEQQPACPEQPRPSTESVPRQDGRKPELLCTSCGVRITEKVARFCRVNRDRFGGGIYCIECQRSKRRTSSAH
jgi:hypothetical protein